MIGYLIVYLLGVATPYLFTQFVLPKFKVWLKKEVKSWK